MLKLNTSRENRLIFQSRIGESRMVHLTAEEQRAINRGSAGLSKDGDQKLLGGLGYFTNKTTGKISSSGGSDVLFEPPTDDAIDGSINTADDVVDIEQQIEDSKSAIYTDPADERDSARSDLIKRINNATSSEERKSLEGLLSIVNEPTSLETSAVLAADARSQEKAAFANRIERQRQINEDPNEAGQIAKSATGAVIARNASGAGGAQVSSSSQQKELQGIVGEKFVSSAMASDAELNKLSAIISSSQAKIRNLAKVAKNTEQQTALSQEISRVESLQDIFKGYADAKETAQKNTFDFVKNLDPAALAAFDETELTSIFSEAGISPTMARGVQANAVKLAEAKEQAEKSKNEKDIAAAAQAQVDLQQSIKDLDAVETTALDAKINTLEKLRDAGTLTEKEFDAALQEELGTRDKPQTPLEAAKTKKTEAEAEITQLQADAARAELEEGSQVPSSSSAGITVERVSDDEISVNTPEGYKAECGRGVNDFYGKSGFMLDSFADKFSKTDSSIEDPDAGMFFAIPLKGKFEANGHCGIITQNNGDGTVETWEMNWGKNQEEQTKTRNIKDIMNGGGFGRNPNPETIELPESAFDLTGKQQSYLGYLNTGSAPSGVTVDDKFIKEANKFQKTFREGTKEYDTQFRVLRNNMALGVGVSNEDRNIKFNNMYDAMLRGDDELVTRLARNGILDGSEEEGRYDSINGQVNILENIKRKLDGMVIEEKDLGRLSQGFEKTAKFLGQTTDPALLELKTLMDMAISETTKLISGGNASDTERDVIEDMFGSIGQEIENNFTRINAIQDSARIKRDTPLRRELGNDFDAIFGDDIFDPIIPSLREAEGAPKTLEDIKSKHTTVPKTPTPVGNKFGYTDEDE